MVEASPFMVKPLKTFFRPDGIVSVTALYAGSLVIILIAWIHLGVIQTTRAIAGQRETAMRAVLGANTGALMRRWMVEGSVLGIVSLSATYLAMPAVLGVVVALLPASFTRGQPVAVDHRVLAYLSVLTCVGILALALGPVVIVRQTRLTDALRGRPSGWPRFGYHRVRLVLLGLQVGLATAVLYLAATAVHDFIRIRGVDVGFDVQHVVSIEVPAAPGGSGTVSEALRSLPFVIGVAPGTIPLLDGKTLESVSASKPQGPEDFKNPNALSVSAAPGYFKALGLTIMEGDDFGHAGSSDGVLLSAALVQRLRLTRPVVGQNLYVGGLRKTVVGMVSDIRGDGPDAGPSPFVYDKGSAEYRTLLIRTSRPVAEVLGHLVDTVRAGADVRGPLRVVLASDRYKAATADLQARMTLLFLLAASGFGLGAIGVFATTTEVVRRRARDTAVRLALGQRPSDVVWNVVRQAVLSSLVGGAVGLAVGAAAASLASAFTPGRSGADPLAAVVVAALLVGSASLASLGPAIRVARADPLRMLREE
jgi:putative ABC transport system permease protein